MMHRISRPYRVALAALSLTTTTLGFSAPAYAWGAQGHEYVGNLGWQALNPKAQAQVRALLGSSLTLGQAAVWADCLRSVQGSPATNLRFVIDQFTPRVCRLYDDNGAEEARITDYARRNYSGCEYAGRRAECNLSYHFANVNLHDRQSYQLGFFGTGPQDVVQAINAAITVLRCPDGQVCPVNAPFDIKDKREALFLLAHFVGDVHQPLHVGAVYLDGQFHETGDDGANTVGGNFLLMTPGQSSDNLHHEWDTLLQSLGTSPSSTAIAAACRISPLPNPTMQRPEDWATESVVAARIAYNGMIFSRTPTETKYWDIQLSDAPGYANNRKAVQGRQVVTAGARLAAVLNAVWPSRTRASACGASNLRANARRNRT